MKYVLIMTTTKTLGYFNFSRAIENCISIARRAMVEKNKCADCLYVLFFCSCDTVYQQQK